MDPLSSLLSLAFIIFSLFVGGIVFVIRTIVEYIWKNAPNNKLWENVILPIVPALIGAVIAYFATMYPYSTGFTSTSGRCTFGFVAGLFSGLLYRVVKSLLKQKLDTTRAADQSVVASMPTSAANSSVPTMSADLHKDPPA